LYCCRSSSPVSVSDFFFIHGSFVSCCTARANDLNSTAPFRVTLRTLRRGQQIHIDTPEPYPAPNATSCGCCERRRGYERRRHCDRHWYVCGGNPRRVRYCSVSKRLIRRRTSLQLRSCRSLRIHSSATPVAQRVAICATLRKNGTGRGTVCLRGAACVAGDAWGAALGAAAGARGNRLVLARGAAGCAGVAGACAAGTPDDSRQRYLPIENATRARCIRLISTPSSTLLSLVVIQIHEKEGTSVSS
jgi:hypothetical protein